MTKETYIKLTQPFRERPGMAKVVHIANKVCTLTMYVAYPILIIYLYMTKNENLYRAILVPAVSFSMLTLVRAMLNRPRPYEVFQMPPVIPKTTKGNSFPSRHVFSATVISMTFLFLSPWWWIGVIFLGVSIVLAIVRVLSGVHFPSDVFVGFVVAVLATLIGYIMI